MADELTRGVRLALLAALGASRGIILSMIVRQGLVLTSIGIVTGLVAAVPLTRVISSLLFGVSPADPATCVGVTGTLLLVALVACWIPASRAARTDPMDTLRAE